MMNPAERKNFKCFDVLKLRKNRGALVASLSWSGERNVKTLKKEAHLPHGILKDTTSLNSGLVFK